jgi:hypothetical protein
LSPLQDLLTLAANYEQVLGSSLLSVWAFDAPGTNASWKDFFSQQQQYEEAARLSVAPQGS